jgi:hypothetical protein
MFDRSVLHRLMKADRDDRFNSYGEQASMRTMHGGIRYRKHPLPEMGFEPDNLFTGEEMYEDEKPHMIGGRMVGGKKSIGKSILKGLKSVGKAIAPVAKDVVMPVVKDFATKEGRKLLEKQLAKFAVQDVLPVAEEASPLLLAAGRNEVLQSSKKRSASKKSGGRLIGGATGSDKRSRRAMLVKKIMQEQGISLPMASKYIKENGIEY